jgi:hypothetical protein
MTTDPDRLFPEINLRKAGIWLATLAVAGLVVWLLLPGPAWRWELEQDGALATLTITMRGKGITEAAFDIKHPEGFAFVTVQDEEDSEKVLRVWRVEERTVTLRLSSPAGLQGAVTRLRYSGDPSARDNGGWTVTER